MNFNTQICTTIEQSERLLALGLNRRTADMVHSPLHTREEHIYYLDPEVLIGSLRESVVANDEGYEDYIPAWSLHRLIILCGNIACDWIFRNDDCYTNAIGCIEWLIKKGYFNKEYLV